MGTDERDMIEYVISELEEVLIWLRSERGEVYHIGRPFAGFVACVRHGAARAGAVESDRVGEVLGRDTSVSKWM